MQSQCTEQQFCRRRFNANNSADDVDGVEDLVAVVVHARALHSGAEEEELLPIRSLLANFRKLQLQ